MGLTRFIDLTGAIIDLRRFRGIDTIQSDFEHRLFRRGYLN